MTAQANPRVTTRRCISGMFMNLNPRPRGRPVLICRTRRPRAGVYQIDPGGWKKLTRAQLHQPRLAKLPAGGVDVVAAGSPEMGHHLGIVENLDESLHPFVGGTLVNKSRDSCADGVVGDEVHVGAKAVHQP